MNITTKRSRMIAGVVLAATGGLLLAGGALADEAGHTGTNLSSGAAAPATPQSTAVDNAALAARLAAYGHEQGSALALLVAGQIQNGLSPVEQPRTKTSEAGTPGTPPASVPAKAARPQITPAALFAEARTMAGGDADLVARIDRAASRATKGAVNGPIVHRDQVNSRTSDWYTIAFRGGERARVAAVGDHDTDLDLYVYDSNGNLICSDTDNTDTTYCAWTPAWTGNFRVKVSNYGYVYNAYTLMTN